MIRLANHLTTADDPTLPELYLRGCEFDPIFGTRNASLYRLYCQHADAFFWVILDTNGTVIGNMSFYNFVFSLSLPEKISSEQLEELLKFLLFWKNFSAVCVNKCIADKLYILLGTDYISADFKGYSLISNSTCTNSIEDKCKAKSLVGSIFDIYDLLAISDPVFTPQSTRDEWYYDMHYRLRHQEICFYGGYNEEDSLTAIAAIMAKHQQNAVIGLVATHPDHRRKGYALQTVRYLIAQHPHTDFYLLASDEAASSLYRKLGFQECGTWCQISLCR